MRRHFLYPALLTLVLLLSFARRASPGDANKIIDQYVKAAGGSKALSKIQTVSH